VPDVRAFSRADRDQLTALVNLHISAVVPGWAVPTSVLLSQLERDPGQPVTDPWVRDRSTLVAVDRDRLVAAAHLRRYRDDDSVGPDYRGAGEIAWLLCRPDALEAGAALTAACVHRLDAWAVRRQYADGDLPTAATYGVHEAWPHVRRLLRAAGFDDAGARSELHLAGSLDAVPPPGRPPLPGLTVVRTVGVHAARLSAVVDDAVAGFVEAVDDHTRAGAMHRLAGWADLAELHVRDDLRRAGIGTHLVRHLASWLRLGGTQRLLIALGEDDLALEPFFARFGWTPIGRTRRGWERR
jgi:GNAT superfamily N-acetyltransferase